MNLPALRPEKGEESAGAAGYVAHAFTGMLKKPESAGHERAGPQGRVLGTETGASIAQANAVRAESPKSRGDVF